MRYDDRRIKGIADLLRALRERKAHKEGTVWYRGQSQLDWNLIPTLARKKAYADAEAALIKRFRQNALPYLSAHPQSEWEWLFLMQHYRVPTRLLDWSESPLAALYFAVNEKDDKDGALWCLNPIALNSNAGIKYRHGAEIPAFDYDEVLKNYLPSRLIGETTSDLSPIAAIGPRNSPRIAAQLGVFTINHRSYTPVEDVGDQKHVWRLVIPSDSKTRIREELSYLRFTSLNLFPELEKAAEVAAEILK